MREPTFPVAPVTRMGPVLVDAALIINGLLVHRPNVRTSDDNQNRGHLASLLSAVSGIHEVLQAGRIIFLVGLEDREWRPCL
jgi:hypothetical protein